MSLPSASPTVSTLGFFTSRPHLSYGSLISTKNLLCNEFGSFVIAATKRMFIESPESKSKKYSPFSYLMPASVSTLPKSSPVIH